ncbi:LacI family DNA-binding transcriptional regulator [Jiangella alkaliphila]|uniref:Transcriptional regulator, LacI family n=1 Tax=Jiangella alkaliphila TaxID=419479 RepID=A0A1H2K1R7_9ACTN|nr:LacI family DNA-binding transcriptional regulator [Jiangella alkaliphila]SDU62654.1 transcriptional regulator, LacI family [Jiangella alkaliphila]
MAEQPRGSVTLMDVAARAGVSLATASRALNGSTRRVGDDLRERVLAAARSLNYAANAQAQAMARGRTNVVGLVVHDIADPYFSSIAAGVMEAAEGHHVLVTLGSTLRRPEREVDYLVALRGQRSRAVILAGSRMDDSHVAEALRREIDIFENDGGNVVAISQKQLPVDTVVIENRLGARDLATELVALGYRRFGVLAGPDAMLTARDRVHGFREGLGRSGVDLDPAFVVHGAFTRDGGYQAMRALLGRIGELDCVFAVNDVMAVGAMVAGREQDLEIPRDLGLAGFDDISTLRDINPALTTVRLPLEKVGASAFELVLSAAERTKPRIRRIKGEVVLRQSTRPAAPG